MSLGPSSKDSPNAKKRVSNEMKFHCLKASVFLYTVYDLNKIRYLYLRTQEARPLMSINRDLNFDETVHNTDIHIISDASKTVVQYFKQCVQLKT